MINTMNKFFYGAYYKFLYRYGNIPVTLILFIYLLVFSSSLNKGYFYILFFLISALLIYKINSFYFELYKILPFNIEIKGDEMIFSGFFFRKGKQRVIKFEDIGTLEGGVFQKKYTGLMKIHDSKNNLTIGFFQTLTGAKLFETILLNKVPKEVYDIVSERMGLSTKSPS